MTEKERDEKLETIDRGYHQRAYNYEQKLDEIRSRAQEKQDRGEDISAEVKEFEDVKELEDKNFDEWKENRQKVFDEYEKDHEFEQDKDYEQEK